MSPLSMAIGLAWCGIVAWAAFLRRPQRGRLQALREGQSDKASQATRRRWQGGVRVWIGARVLRLLRRPADPVTACRIGGALVAASAAAVVLPLAAVPAAAVGWAVPGVAESRRRRRNRQAVAANLPEIVDLLALVVGAGLTVRLAVEAVARRGRGPLADELRRTVEEAGLGRRLADALEDVVARLGEEVRPLIAVLVASERYGAPLAVALERLARDARHQRRRRAEEAARKIPVKLLFPLVSCTLPAFALLTVAPLVASAIQSLRL